jgi:rhodanese-related sulfurtransferase
MKRPLTLAVTVALFVALVAAVWGARALVAPPGAESAQARVVQKVPTEQVLEWIGEGKRVIFVDARESQEFDEEHIPGAINLSLRELENADPQQFGQPDLIVAYCMKDFRGYEVAKALKRAGFPQSAILREYGIAGWKKQGLPTVVRDAQNEQEVQRKLESCARSPQGCIKKG